MERTVVNENGSEISPKKMKRIQEFILEKKAARWSDERVARHVKKQFNVKEK